MEVDSQKVDANEVLVTISGDNENSKTQKKMKILKVLKFLHLGLTLSLSIYLPQETSVAQLAVLESLTSRTQMASLTSSLSIEISNLNSPALNNKSFKVPEESAVTRRRWRDPYIQSRNQD